MNYYNKNKSDNFEFWSILILAVLLIILMFVVNLSGVRAGYRQGQLDALHGIWKYQVVTNSVEDVVKIK